MLSIQEIFARAVSEERPGRPDAGTHPPRCRYVIAMTPRSGSSYLCDLMKKTRRLGDPRELLAREFLSDHIRYYGGESPDEYLHRAIDRSQSRNRVSGFKASWFQFNDFMQAMADANPLSGFSYIYLFRRDIAMQAVSLYKATESGVFHTNVAQPQSALRTLRGLRYDFEKIYYWHKHIAAQEAGWQEFFLENGIVPLTLTYEEIDTDSQQVLRRIAKFLKVRPENVVLPETKSVFSRVSDRRNRKWAQRFTRDLEAGLGEDMEAKWNGTMSTWRWMWLRWWWRLRVLA